MSMLRTVLLLVCIGLLLPSLALAWPAKFTSCSSCHSASEPTANIDVAINAVQTTSVTVAPGGSFEIDYIVRNIAGSGVLGLEVALPTGWTVGTGTVNSPALTGWSSAWDGVSGVPAGWATASMYSTATEFPNSPDGYTINFDATGWDSGNRNAAFDNATAADLDGVANTMGTDALITVPGGAADGPYSIQVTGAGHNVGGTKGFVTQTITVTVSSGPDVTPPNVTTTVPTNSAVDIALNAQVTINFDEPMNCGTVTTTNITSDSPTWTLNNCSGSTALFDTGGQANNTTYNISVTAAVTDVAGNPLNAAPYNFNYTTIASGNTAPNNPPGVSLTQFQSDGISGVTAGAFTSSTTLVMKGQVTDPEADTVQLQVEIQPIASAFTNTPNCTSAAPAASGSTCEATCGPLADGLYKWQARGRDNNGASSAWVQY
jgi:hypothetical protein